MVGCFRCDALVYRTLFDQLPGWSRWLTSGLKRGFLCLVTTCLAGLAIDTRVSSCLRSEESNLYR